MSRATRLWYGLMATGGFLFGLIANKRPFGEDIFAHPLVIFFVLVGVGLLVLRLVLARPVPEILPERTMLFGCFVGLALFLGGNFLVAHLIR